MTVATLQCGRFLEVAGVGEFYDWLDVPRQLIENEVAVDEADAAITRYPFTQPL
jgi:hypothetical protein